MYNLLKNYVTFLNSFLKDLLMKTPGSIRLANLNRLKETLGIDGNQSGLSWTSSLATPAQDKGE